MPTLEEIDTQCGFAVLWRRYGTDRQGEPVVSRPEEVGVRWVDRRSQTSDPKGQVVATDADVACDCAVPEGSIMWRGQMGDVPGTASPPEPETDLFEVVSSSTGEDLKGNITRYELKLRRWNDSLPTVTDAFV